MSSVPIRGPLYVECHLHQVSPSEHFYPPVVCIRVLFVFFWTSTSECLFKSGVPNRVLSYIMWLYKNAFLYQMFPIKIPPYIKCIPLEGPLSCASVECPLILDLLMCAHLHHVSPSQCAPYLLAPGRNRGKASTFVQKKLNLWYWRRECMWSGSLLPLGKLGRRLGSPGTYGTDFYQRSLGGADHHQEVILWTEVSVHSSLSLSK